MHGALHRPSNTKVLAERLEIDLLILIGKSRPAPDHECIGHLCEVGRQVSRNTVSEIILLWIIVEVRKWQHDKRQARNNGGPNRSFSLCLLPVLKNLGADRLPDVPKTKEAAGHRADGGNRGERAAGRLQARPKPAFEISV